MTSISLTHLFSDRTTKPTAFVATVETTVDTAHGSAISTAKQQDSRLLNRQDIPRNNLRGYHHRSHQVHFLLIFVLDIPRCNSPSFLSQDNQVDSLRRDNHRDNRRDSLQASQVEHQLDSRHRIQRGSLLGKPSRIQSLQPSGTFPVNICVRYSSV
jgi:hypothetical protein